MYINSKSTHGGGFEVEVNLLLSLEIDINVSVKNVPHRLLYPLLLLYIYLPDA